MAVGPLFTGFLDSQREIASNRWMVCLQYVVRVEVPLVLGFFRVAASAIFSRVLNCWLVSPFWRVIEIPLLH